MVSVPALAGVPKAAFAPPCPMVMGMICPGVAEKFEIVA
jgi:hypothetical protein